MSMVSLETLRRSPDPVGAALATIFGVSLLILGISWAAFDRSMLVMEIAFIVVGLAALPWISRRLHDAVAFSGGAHVLAAIAALLGGFMWTVAGPSADTMNKRFVTTAAQAAGLVSMPLDVEATETADNTAAKAAYLNKIAAANADLATGIDPVVYHGDRDAVMTGLSLLSSWRALCAQAEAYTLAPEEQAQVTGFNTAAEGARATLLPALRGAYADSLRNALANYGVTAEASGAKSDNIEIIGYALNDQRVQAKVRALLSSDLAALGYTKVDFVADKSAQASDAVATAPEKAVAPTQTSAAAPTIAPTPAFAAAPAQVAAKVSGPSL
jgi:hypothetical protein